MSDDLKMPASPAKPQLRLVGLQSKVDSLLKADAPKKPTNASGEILTPEALEVEDEYHLFYIGSAQDAGIIAPPFSPTRLYRLAQENNALSPCIEAMVTNVDGTGYDFEREGEDAEDEEDDTKIEALEAFFAEPWPGMSFVTQRKEVRRDLESTGNGYFEVIRNAQDDIVFLRRIDTKMMRLMKLDAAVPVKKEVIRGGRKQTVQVMLRERRFVQLVNGVQMLYFKEFGASRDLNKKTGNWADAGKKLPADQRATEVIHLKLLPDALTPYGVPRWVNQMPSVLGSRKAEEFNLEFFDNGGIPPVLILLQGGTLQSETRKALEQKMGKGDAASKNRVQILEVEPSAGSLDKEGRATVTVERFGAERQNDAMFENYDERCEDRIRRAFRLPPIFVGKADDYSFATAFASYTVAEAQVFKPERDEFDEIITMKLIAALGYVGYKMISKPLVIEDANMKLAGIETAVATGRADPEDLIWEINEAVGTNIKVTEEKPGLPQPIPGGSTHTVDPEGNIVPIPGLPINPPANSNKPAQNGSDRSSTRVAQTSRTNSRTSSSVSTSGGKASTPVRAPATPMAKSEYGGVEALAKDMIFSLRKRDWKGVQKCILLASSLDEYGMAQLKKATANITYLNVDLDPEGLAELAACTTQVMLDSQEHMLKADGTCSCGQAH